jgi:vanillate O-demethylase monooxygenase subunit
MRELEFWNPVLRSEELGARPREVELCGRKLVVFRAAGGIGALDNACPHRGAPLSAGHVEGDAVVCPYHGWRWDSAGRGVTPNTRDADGRPAVIKACARRYEAVERLGAIWLKAAASTEPFPTWELAGHTEFTRLRRLVRAPLELVLDNFIEVEHTPSVHAFLGYPKDRMAEVEVETVTTADSVRVRNVGPQRRLPWALRRLFGIPDHALFVDEWTTTFRPVCTVYDQYILDARTRQRVTELLRTAIFFTPVTERTTQIFALGYTDAPLWQGLGPLRVLLARALVSIELSLDARLLARMGEVDVSLAGRPLGRFDKGVLAARKRLDSVYRGRTQPEPRIREPRRHGEPAD